MSDRIRVSDVFVPGRLPEYTYNPRAELQLETRLQDYLEETGSILTVAGPTKTGKSVLLRRVIQQPIWVDGQGIDNVDELWRRIGDSLGIYTDVEVAVSNSATGKGGLQSKAQIVPGFVSLGAAAEYSVTDGTNRKLSVERPIRAVVRDALLASRRPLVIDDFHFVDRGVQREVVRALKPLVFEGAPIVFSAISHRVEDVVTAEFDMTGRVSALNIPFWSVEDLLVIARRGFTLLNIVDPDDQIAMRLANESYGSPHLMQKFCREICKQDNIREGFLEPRTILLPTDWAAFFESQIDAASSDWFYRLLRGPQERGSQRTKWVTRDGLTLDGYGLTLYAIATTGPRLSIGKDDLKKSIEELVAGDSEGPAVGQTTRVLQHMTRIAAKRTGGEQVTEEQLEEEIRDQRGVPVAQPVLEYIDEGPTSQLHIADPFFAFYLKWGSRKFLAEHSANQGSGDN